MKTIKFDLNNKLTNALMWVSMMGYDLSSESTHNYLEYHAGDTCRLIRHFMLGIIKMFFLAGSVLLLTCLLGFVITDFWNGEPSESFLITLAVGLFIGYPIMIAFLATIVGCFMAEERLRFFMQDRAVSKESNPFFEAIKAKHGKICKKVGAS